MERIGHTVRRLVEQLERTAKARNEAPDASEGRDELRRLSGFDEFQISSVEGNAAPTAYAGRNDEPQIVRQGHTPANNEMRHAAGARPARSVVPRGSLPAARPASANDNKIQWSLLNCEASRS